jgi:hypothetical protein
MTVVSVISETVTPDITGAVVSGRLIVTVVLQATPPTTIPSIRRVAKNISSFFMCLPFLLNVSITNISYPNSPYNPGIPEF